MPTAVSGNSFNAANEMTVFNGVALSYDANGNLTGDGTNTYSWDARNHLVAISGPVDAGFVYDAFGRRMGKTINGATTEFLYDGPNPVQELNGNNLPSPTANLLTGLDIDRSRDAARLVPVSGARPQLEFTVGLEKSSKDFRN